MPGFYIDSILTRRYGHRHSLKRGTACCSQILVKCTLSDEKYSVHMEHFTSLHRNPRVTAFISCIIFSLLGVTTLSLPVKSGGALVAPIAPLSEYWRYWNTSYLKVAIQQSPSNPCDSACSYFVSIGNFRSHHHISKLAVTLQFFLNIPHNNR